MKRHTPFTVKMAISYPAGSLVCHIENILVYHVQRSMHLFGTHYLEVTISHAWPTLTKTGTVVSFWIVYTSAVTSNTWWTSGVITSANRLIIPLNTATSMASTAKVCKYNTSTIGYNWLYKCMCSNICPLWIMGIV